MSAQEQVPLDTRDMVALHAAFKRAFGEAPGQIAAVSDGDATRARQFADYLSEVLWLLHVHHVGEDELLYPVLLERAPEHRELFSRMDEQHKVLSSSMQTTELAAQRFGMSGSQVDGRELARSCEGVLTTSVQHLSDEEDNVLPIASRLMSPAEWGAMPAHALSQYRGSRVWLPFGLALEAMPDDIRENLLAHLPPPVAGMWNGGGADAFTNEMSIIRGVA